MNKRQCDQLNDLAVARNLPLPLRRLATNKRAAALQRLNCLTRRLLPPDPVSVDFFDSLYWDHIRSVARGMFYGHPSPRASNARNAFHLSLDRTQVRPEDF